MFVLYTQISSLVAAFSIVVFSAELLHREQTKQTDPHRRNTGMRLNWPTVYFPLCECVFVCVYVFQIKSLSQEDLDAYLSQAVCLRLKSVQELEQIKVSQYKCRISKEIIVVVFFFFFGKNMYRLNLLSKPGVNLLNFLLQDNVPEVYSRAVNRNKKTFPILDDYAVTRRKHYQSDSWVCQQIREKCLQP